MKSNIIAATILALGLVLAAFLYSGRYYVVVVDKGVAVRVDRWTGETKTIETADKLDAWWEKYERRFSI